MNTANPRFPHMLTLKRVTETTSQDDPFVAPVNDDPFAAAVNRGTVVPSGATTSTSILYEGKCRSYRNVMTKTRDGVLVSDYVIAMPRADFAILPGDLVVVMANNRTMNGVVVDSQTTNFGTNIWWNKNEN